MDNQMGIQRPNRLKEIALQQGEDVGTLVVRTVREEGSVYGAAVKLGVARNTIHYWLKKVNFVVETRRVTTLEERHPEAV